MRAPAPGVAALEYDMFKNDQNHSGGFENL